MTKPTTKQTGGNKRPRRQPQAALKAPEPAHSPASAPETAEPTQTLSPAPTRSEAPALATPRVYPVDLEDLGKEDPQYRYAHCYLYGPNALSAGKTYGFLYPNATENTKSTEASRILNNPKTAEYIRTLCAQRKISREFVEHELTREITRRVTRRTKEVVTQDGDIITLSSTEERDRVPALMLAADILGMRKGPEVQGVTVHVHMGAGLDLAEDSRPIDVTPER